LKVDSLEESGKDKGLYTESKCGHGSGQSYSVCMYVRKEVIIADYILLTRVVLPRIDVAATADVIWDRQQRNVPNPPIW
jgi:hypothetical protein